MTCPVTSRDSVTIHEASLFFRCLSSAAACDGQNQHTHSSKRSASWQRRLWSNHHQANTGLNLDDVVPKRIASSETGLADDASCPRGALVPTQAHVHAHRRRPIRHTFTSWCGDAYCPVPSEQTCLADSYVPRKFGFREGRRVASSPCLQTFWLPK